MAMRELREINALDYDVVANEESNPLNQALQAVRAGDKPSAGLFWDRACVRMPAHIVKSVDSIEILLTLGRLDELEALLREGRKSSPSNRQYIVGLAQLYEKKSDLQLAAVWWRSLRRRWPADFRGYVGGADCLAELGRLEEAAAILKVGTGYLPNEPEILIRRARIAAQLKDWPTALKAWGHMADELGKPVAVVGAAQVLEAMGDDNAARVRLLDGRTKYPYDRDILIALARLTERLESPVNAMTYWNDLRMVFPRWKPAYNESARCLSLVGRHDDAVVVWDEWKLRFPEAP